MTNQELELNKSYARVSFLSSILVEEIDKLRESTEPMRNFKRHLNGVISEVKILSKRHYDMIKSNGSFEAGGHLHDGEDIYSNTLDAYRGIFTRDVQDVIGINELMKQAEERGIEFNKIDVIYEPLQK